jgi:hypothetical protein
MCKKRNEKAARFSVPLPKVKGISEEEMFKVVSTGKVRILSHDDLRKRSFLWSPTPLGPPHQVACKSPPGLLTKHRNTTSHMLRLKWLLDYMRMQLPRAF